MAGGSGDLGIKTNRSSSFKGKGQTAQGSSVESVVSCTITEIITPINDYKSNPRLTPSRAPATTK